MKEIFRPHPKYTEYLFSVTGKVRRVDGRQATIRFRGRYVRVWISGKGWHMVHVGVMEVFVGPKPRRKVVRHLDGDVFNNRLSNLAYGTEKQNARDRVLHGRQRVGKRCPLTGRFVKENKV